MNEADDSETEEELFLALMADFDESLAAGDTAGLLAEIPAGLQPRLARNLDVIHLVRRSLRRPAAANTPDREATALATEVPNQLGRFLIRGELGRGGMGIVYRAYDTKRDQIVALKSLPRLEPTALYRFKAEFRRLADVSHPNLVALYELFAEGGRWFFTMELIQGVDFLSHVKEVAHSTPDYWERLRGALRQLADGVAALHTAGKLHRDIKPHNVLVTPAGRVVLLDFGLAAEFGQTELGSHSEPHVLGTVPYLSPEQGAGLPLTPASDWYSVGVMLYVALTGRLPFRGSALQILRAKEQGEPPAPHEVLSTVPEDFDRLCVDLLRRDPSHRASGSEVICRLGRSRETTFSPPSTHRWRRVGVGGARLAHETSTPLVGREPHRRALSEAFEVVKRGRPVTMYLHGPSGVGKTALAHGFLGALREQDEAVILAGQCFEQESVPYKAVDGMVDNLSAYLGRLESAEVQGLLPRDVTPLARVFPVLRRVEAVNAAAQPLAKIPDPQEVRRRAFAGLRELLTRLGALRPLVLFIDDLQWGDLDSAALLLNLLQPPDPPVLFFLGCYRSEETEVSPFLRELLRSRGAAEISAEQSELSVEVLEAREARELALQLLGDPTATQLADAIALESEGNPFFVHALADHVRARQADFSCCLTEEVSFVRAFSERMACLPQEVCRLLGIVAVAGRPLGEEDAWRAAQLTNDQLAALNVLRSHRLVRAISAEGETGITIYHDRVREAVMSRLPPDVVREHHHRLALSLELSGRADAEMVAVHFHGAGELERAGCHYALAADHAAQTLAFDRAARLYRLVLELRPVSAEEECRLRERLGDVLANAGRGAEAAPVFLEAAQSSAALPALQLRQRAALQYLVSGHVDEGLMVLGTVLAAVGLRLPPTPRQALVSLLSRRAKLWLRGLRFRQHSAAQVAAVELARIDICHAAAAGVGAFDNILGAAFQSLELLLALRAGEPARLARALLGESLYVGMFGGKTARRAARLLMLAERIYSLADHPRLTGTLCLARGAARGMQGQWHSAAEDLAAAEQIFRERCTDVRWGINLSQVLGMWNLYMQGELVELRRRLSPAIDEAGARGDLYALAYMLALLRPYEQLAADQPHDCRRDLDTLRHDWKLRRFSIPHIILDFAHVQVDLYLGDTAPLARHLNELWLGLTKSHHLRLQFWRIIAGDLRARAALTVAATGDNARRHIAAAERDARSLEREKTPWGDALAGLLRAGIAAIQRDRTSAVRLLGDTVDRFEAADMGIHAAIARRCLGGLLGGVQGNDFVAQADAWMKAHRIVNPARLTAMYAPSFPAV
jgi:hypothetical protein